MSKKVDNKNINSKNRNNKKQIPESAPKSTIVTTIKEETKPSTVIDVLDVNNFKKVLTTTAQEGLDPNHRVDLLKMLHETFRLDKDAAVKYNMSEETVNKINAITAIGQIAALSCEIVYAKNPFALKMNASELQNIISLGSEVGLDIDIKALPEAKEDGTVEVPSTALKVSKETKQQIQHEKTIEEEKPELDPTKVYNDENAISKAIQYIFAIHKNSVFNAIDESLKFLKSVRLYAASKTENADAEKDKIETRNIRDWFNDLTSLFKPTVLFNGIGKHMATITHYTGSPVAAFAVLRNASKNKKTGVPSHDDKFIAELTKAIILWVVNTFIDSNKKSIANLDPKKNKEEIEKCNNSIAYYKDTIKNLCTPSFKFVDNIIDNLSSEDPAVKNPAMTTMKSIRESYYSDIDFKKNTYENLNINLKQYAGIIINLFVDPQERNDQYVESNITELVPISNPEEKKEEVEVEKKEETEEKKA